MVAGPVPAIFMKACCPLHSGQRLFERAGVASPFWWGLSIRSMAPSLCPPARLSVVPHYGPWFTRSTNAPVTALAERSQGCLNLTEKYFSSGSYLATATTNKVAPRPWLICRLARLVNGQNRVTFCERLRRDVHKTRQKTRFGHQKTRSKKALIISFIAQVNGNPEFSFPANFATVLASNIILKQKQRSKRR